MALVVKCPRCGKSAGIDPADPRDARVLCVACGGAFDAAAEVEAGRVWERADRPDAHRAAVATDDTSDDVELAVAATDVSRAGAAVGRRPARSGLPWLVGSVALLFLAALSVVAVLNRPAGQPTRAARRPTSPAPTTAAAPARPLTPRATTASTATLSQPASGPTTSVAMAATPPPSAGHARPLTPSDVPGESPASRPAGVAPEPGPPATTSVATTAPAPPVAAPVAAERPERRPVVTRPPLRPTPIPKAHGVDDEMIEASIRRGIESLAGRFREKERHVQRPKLSDLMREGARGKREPVWDEYLKTAQPGLNALAVYALLQAGLAVDDRRLNPRGELGSALLDVVRDSRIPGRLEVYSLAARICCLAVFNRTQDRDVLRADVGVLANGHRKGAYSYTRYEGPPDGPAPPGWEPGTFQKEPAPVGPDGVPKPMGRWDNSNSQYGLLGVWVGADAGVTVPEEYWTAVQSHWERQQEENGTWEYMAPPAQIVEAMEQARRKQKVRRAGPDPATTPGNLSMTSAGVASLLVVRDQLAALKRSDKLGEPPFTPALQAGLAWFEHGDHSVKIDHRDEMPPGYVVYGVERVGLASGFKYFGTHDWYRELAALCLSRQEAGGGWGGTGQDAYHLLFLSRGRHPILFNKLRFDGFWSNRPRNLAGLTPWVSRQTERQLNWQIVNVDADWHDWLDSPVLYIASHKRPNFTDAQLDKLRNYALAGGLIFTHADGEMPEFDEYATELARKLFPQYEYGAVPPNHPVYNVVFKLDWQKAPLRMISNGSRLLMVHSSKDVAKHWQWRDYHLRPEAFRLPVNLHVYAAGKRDLRHRLATPYVPEPVAAAPVATVGVARVRYNGDWDPEPGAWQRFARLMEFRTGTRADVQAVQWADLSAEATPFAHLTGAARYVPTEAEVAALRAYVEAGGVLLVDNCGGGSAFTDGLRDALAAAFPGGSTEPLDAAHPLLSAGPPGMAALSPPVVRPYASEFLKLRDVPPIQATYAGKGTVLVSKLDVASGLLGTGTWGIMGYAPKWSEAFVQNALLWTMDGQPTVRVASPATAPVQ